MKLVDCAIVEAPFGALFVIYDDIRLYWSVFSENSIEKECQLFLQQKNQQHYNIQHKRKFSLEDFEARLDNIIIEQEGTSFQKKVWKQIATTEETTTYRQIAEKIGNAKAVRAVGTTCGANSVAYFVPCHRVIKTNGDLGRYKWGATLKKKILLFEEQQRASI